MLTALKSCTPTTLKNHYMIFKHWNFVRFVAFVCILVNFEFFFLYNLKMCNYF
jgi:hypothetical protein